MSLLRFVLASLPFGGFFVGIFFANRVEPYVLGMPFIMFWVVLWVVLTAAIMGLIYLSDPANREGANQ